MRAVIVVLPLFAFAATTARAEDGGSGGAAVGQDGGSGGAAGGGDAGGAAQAPVSTAEAEYAQHMDNGVKLYREGDQPAALAEFDAAYRALPKASPLINKALCYKKLKRYGDAIDSLERALRDHRETLEERHKAAAEKEIAELRPLIAWLVVTVPPGARLFVDNTEGEYEPRRDPDGSVPLAPGPNRLRAEAAGFAAAVQTVTLVAGRANTPVALVPTAKDGDVEIHAAAAAHIDIDGREVGQGQYQGQLDPGVHIVRVRDGAKPSSLPILVVAGKRALVIEQADGTLVSDAKAPIDTPTTPAPDAPTFRGFYLLGTAGIITIVNNVNQFVRNDAAQAGYSFGGAVGYRVARWGAFEAFGRYDDVRVHGVFNGSDLTNQQFIVRGGRGGLALRAMFPGDRWIRFAGVIGGGAVFDALVFKNAPASPLYQSESGINVFGELDLMLELDLSHILIDVGAQHTAQSSKHFSHDDGSNVFEEKPILFIGPKVQVGYAFW